MELTPEQLQKAESMPLVDLRALILTPDEQKEAQPAAVTPKVEEKAAVVEKVEAAPTIYRKEIPNGASVDVYEAETLEELVEKIAIGKENANKHVRTILEEKKALEARTVQKTTDDDYVLAERLKKEPKQTLEEIVNETIEKRLTKARDAEEVQTRFVNSHPDYIANAENGKRLAAWVQLNGYKEFTSEGLEQAYLDLKASGLLALKPEGTDAATQSTPTVTQTAEAEASTEPTRSLRRGSTVSLRSTRTVAPVNTAPTVDEAYSLPMDKLRELADRQLAERR